MGIHYLARVIKLLEYVIAIHYKIDIIKREVGLG